ncbi:MAG: DUF5069 domain-containing protein [Candidatus Melainabacteria bacterium]|nr:DUF5069 domain-containing protein [Candidatus Melainabacteria bacterium]
MSTIQISEKLKTLALDLTRSFPRSPRETLGGYVIAARTLDKCRAVLNNSQGEYHFNCPLDRRFFDFTELDAEAFKAFVATGAIDEEVAEWIVSHAKTRDRSEIVEWNNDHRYKRISDLPAALQVYFEDYIPQFVPKGKVVYHWFDVYDYEEGRL